MDEISVFALQAFRAVARCGSFTAAASDLGCAQSAVSRSVARLEGRLRQTLVLRGHRSVQLTPAGKLYLETADRVLDELAHGARRLVSAEQGQSKVKLLAMPSFAARWLIPRLTRLALARINVEIELATSIWDTDFRKERYDLAIHYGDGSWPGARLLMHDSLVPVAAPRLLAGQRLDRLDDMAKFPWLHDTLRDSKWRQWLMACDARDLASARNMRLQDTDSTLTAAIAGLGIAIGHAVLIDNDVCEGRLLEVWPRQVPLAAGYHLIQARRATRNPAAGLVAEWLMKESLAFRKASDGTSQTHHPAA